MKVKTIMSHSLDTSSEIIYLKAVLKELVDLAVLGDEFLTSEDKEEIERLQRYILGTLEGNLIDAFQEGKNADKNAIIDIKNSTSTNNK